MDNEKSGGLEGRINEKSDLNEKVNEIIEKYDKLIDYSAEDKDNYKIEKYLSDSVVYMIDHVNDLNLVNDFLVINEKYQRKGSKKSYFEFLSNISYLFYEFDNLSKKGATDDLKKMTTKSIETLIEVLNKYGQEEDMIEDLEIISLAAKRMIIMNPYKKSTDLGTELFCDYLKLFVKDSVLSARREFNSKANQK